MPAYYLDHDVARRVAYLLRRSGYPATTARDEGRERAGDDEHLLLAAQRGWVIATHNADDYALLHSAWRRWSGAWNVEQRHSGILILVHGGAELLAQAIVGLAARGLPRTNELYRWAPARGWQLEL